MKEKEEQMFRMFSLLKNILKDVKENEHHFDANSEECKACEDFTICKEFHDMMTAVNNSDYNEDVKNDMAAFIIFMKKEYLFIDDFDIEDILKNGEQYCISGYCKRFDSVNGFKHYDNLISILTDNQLDILRSIIVDVTDDIEKLLITISNINRSQCNILINKLCKTQQEEKEKSYENMTKEELIKELKRKQDR